MFTVSVIVPCYNEQATIHLLLDALRRQTFPLQELEVIIADGMSTDQTRSRIAEYQATNSALCVRVVDNPLRVIPSALNRAIEAAQGEIILRLDGHSTPAPDYVERCVQALQEGRGDNVGGVWEIQPSGKGWAAQGIALAAAHPLGVGDARYRVGGQAQEVETVPFGCYRRARALEIGKYDETLLTNEDYEFNTRLRQAGGKIWMDPLIRSTYFARPTLAALARQYGRYGYWKAQMLRRYPHTLRWRQALPPVFVASLLVLGIAAIWLPLARLLLATELLLYGLIMLSVGLQAALRRHRLTLLISVPLAIACMHIAWGGSLLWGLIHPPASKTGIRNIG